MSAFIKDGGGVFHTYSTYARGLDILIGAYNFLDLAPKGRDEAGAALVHGLGAPARRICNCAAILLRRGKSENH